MRPPAPLILDIQGIPIPPAHPQAEPVWWEARGSEVCSLLEVSNHASAFKGHRFGFGAGRQPELLPHPLRHRQGGRCRLFPPLPIPQQEPRLFWTPGASSSAGWAGAVGASSYGVISGIWGLAGAWIQVFPAGPGCQSLFPPRYSSPWGIPGSHDIPGTHSWNSGCLPALRAIGPGGCCFIWEDTAAN